MIPARYSNFNCPWMYTCLPNHFHYYALDQILWVRVETMNDSTLVNDLWPGDRLHDVRTYVRYVRTYMSLAYVFQITLCRYSYSRCRDHSTSFLQPSTEEISHRVRIGISLNSAHPVRPFLCYRAANLVGLTVLQLMSENAAGTYHTYCNFIQCVCVCVCVCVFKSDCIPSRKKNMTTQSTDWSHLMHALIWLPV